MADLELIVVYDQHGWSLSLRNNTAGLSYRLLGNDTQDAARLQFDLARLIVPEADHYFFWREIQMDMDVFWTLPEDIIDGISDRAACGEWAIPTTLEEYAAWIGDEIEMQQSMLNSDNEECTADLNKWQEYIDYLAAHYEMLVTRYLFVPAKLPWEYPEVRIEIAGEPEYVRLPVAIERYPDLKPILEDPKFERVVTVLDGITVDITLFE